MRRSHRTRRCSWGATRAFSVWAPLLAALIFTPPLVSASPRDSFRFDPVLDEPPQLRIEPQGERWIDSISGLQAGLTGGTYLGTVRSELTRDYSLLRRGARALLGFELGYRFRVPLQISLEADLGFGEAVDGELPRSALDIFLRPKLSYQLIDRRGGGLYLGGGVAAGVFDLKEGALGQSGLGPTLFGGACWRLDRQSRLALELGWWPIYNSFAFYYRRPTEEELEENPALSRIKITGSWTSIFFVQLAYRLSDL